MADAGKVMIFPRGNYDATSVYEVLDLVNHNGASWVAKKSTFNGIIPSEANSEYWFKMAGHIVVNNLNTSAEGYVLDARQGKLLQDALAVERARIDQFTKLAEGSTTGDAELIDARVGADGVTYDNLGTANRTQFANLKSDLSQTEVIAVDTLGCLQTGNYNITTDSYVQCVFSAIPTGKYVLKISTDTEFTTTQIQTRTSANVVSETFAVNETITPTNPCVTIINPTEAINRIRVYAPTASATITLEFFDLEANHSAMTSGIRSLEYVANLTENKAKDITWISDYIVSVQNPTSPVESANFSIANFSVNKGDIITIAYQTGRCIDGGKYTLAEKINFGTGNLDYGFRGLVVGGSDYNEYVAEKDMEVTVCAKTAYLPTVTCYAQKMQSESVDTAKNRFLRFPYTETMRKLTITNACRNGEGTPKPLSLLHFSDVHNTVQNVSAIMDFYEQYGENIDDIILSGDMASTRFTEYKPIYSLERYKNILLTIGNHDVYDADGTAGSDYDNEEYWATNVQKYNQYFAPSIANWNVVQPANADTLGLCYYYKDYSSNGYGYRMIVLDGMAYDDTQHKWLVSTLASAKTNNLTVVIAEHLPPIAGETDVDGFDTPFMSIMKGKESSFAIKYLTTNAGSALDAVDDFINGGGEFACWLCGHTHYDVVAKINSHPNQIYIAIGSASVSVKTSDMPRTLNTPSEDLFNIVSIDPYLKTLKISRFGATIDDWGRVREHLSINYATKTLLT